MSDSTHLIVYQRFFAILTSVLPGLNLVLGLAALILWVLADLFGMEWGWAVGAAAVVLVLSFVGWIAIGLGLQKWAEEKPVGMLAGIAAPFILIDAVFLVWLFIEVVITGPADHAAEAAGTASLVLHTLAAFV